VVGRSAGRQTGTAPRHRGAAGAHRSPSPVVGTAPDPGPAIDTVATGDLPPRYPGFGWRELLTPASTCAWTAQAFVPA